MEGNNFRATKINENMASLLKMLVLCFILSVKTSFFVFFYSKGVAEGPLAPPLDKNCVTTYSFGYHCYLIFRAWMNIVLQ